MREQATQDIRRRVGNCFVALDVSDSIAAYYTFAAASFPLLDLSTDIAKRLPRSGSLPGGLIGRLAVDRRFKDRRLGRSLILDATHRATRADPAIFALVVDAKDEAALGFYRHLGFQPFVSRPMSLLLPIATAIKALAALHGDYDAQFL